MDKTRKYKQSINLSLVTIKRAVYLCSVVGMFIQYFFLSATVKIQLFIFQMGGIVYILYGKIQRNSTKFYYSGMTV